MKISILSFLLMLGATSAGAQPLKMPAIMREDSLSESGKNHKLIIYQMLVRLFGNKNAHNQYYGSIEANGTGKFNDISGKALDELKVMGVSHVWYTGVIEHSTMTDYSAFGIRPDDPDVVKGKAGSPYAIKDYYDVDPDLAENVSRRMQEFEDLVERTHRHGLHVIIDFVPNHVARTYHSDAHPAGVRDFGVDDDIARDFSPLNDFYYIPGKSFIVPAGTEAGGPDFHYALKDGKFDESPAKATGNNVFSASPSIDDWYETVKLNYGVDYQHGEKKYFDPVPPVWKKMRDILLFWAAKGVDGFRCDVAEMVPVEFWNWVIPQIKAAKPGLVFIAEAYNPREYRKYLTVGHFDYLYDKVGLYDALKRLIKNDTTANVKDISALCSGENKNLSSRMLRFLENHDEERIASSGFASNPWYAVPAMVMTATLSGGPVMVYFGQEVGEPGKGVEGFGKQDNRTSIFDYWGVPEHQKWMNNGAFDGAKLSPDQVRLRNFYSALLNFSASSDAIKKGRFMELTNQKKFNNRMYAFLRYTSAERVLVVANFDRKKALKSTILLPGEVVSALAKKHEKAVEITDVLHHSTYFLKVLKSGIPVNVGPSEALILTF